MARHSQSSSRETAFVTTGKSRAEVSALRHLRETYDALALTGVRAGGETIKSLKPNELSSSRASSPAKPIERPPRSRGRVLDTVRALQQTAASPTRNRDVFEQWLVLETVAQAIDTDAGALQREIHAAEARTISSVQLPAEGFDNLDAKLLVLSEVLGQEAFTSYSRDLFQELAALRQRSSLYGTTLKQFQEQVQIRCIGAHRLRDVVSHHEWLEIANASLSALRIATDTPLLVSHFPVLMQHCSPPRSTLEGESLVAVKELLQLLERLPPARERLVALCFEQIGDVRRGSGLAPPPEGIRPHKLAALAKQSHADVLCSQEERDRILAWLEAGDFGDAGTVSRAAFLSYHVTISDVYVREDAEFVAFLMRVWKFEMPQDLGVGDVVADYEARCVEVANITRKREVLKKLDHAKAAFPGKLATLRHLVGQLESVTVKNQDQYQQLASHPQLTSSTLLGVRVLRLNGINLQEFPLFVVLLPLLEELNLADNQLKEPLPLVTIAGMKVLKTFVLSDNFLSDHSFTMPSEDPVMDVWNSLSGLTHLDLSRNQLTSIPSVVLGLNALQHLHLATNKLRENGLTTSAATKWQNQGYPQLQTLDVRENQLSTLPDAIFTTGKRSLEMLYAQDNHLTRVPSEFNLLEGLKVAVFSRNRLKQLGLSDVTPLLARCSELRELALDHNQLKVFPMLSPNKALRIDCLQAIRFLKNRLRVLPSLEHLSFHACEELDLRGNALTEISEAFFPAFPRLRACYLQQNAIRRLPDAIACCSRLQILEIYENKLEYVPPNLAHLQELAILNLRENQLMTLPTEWHMFAKYTQDSSYLRPRVLQTLYVQRNPFKNKVLQTLVDGAIGGGGDATSGAGSVSFKSSATQICEMYLRKLIDLLKETVQVQRLARAVHVETHDDDDNESDDDDCDSRDVSTRRRRVWKGRARFVIQHIEAQLKARCETTTATDESRGRMLLAVPEFQKLLQKLLAASTAKELRRMSERFERCGEDGTKCVDGLSFLYAVEAVGLFNALPATETEEDLEAHTTRGKKTSAQPRCESVRKPVDAVASILQYLQVAHEQKLRPPSPVERVPQLGGHDQQRSRPRSAPAQAPRVTQQRPQSATTPRQPKPNAPTEAEHRPRGRDVQEDSQRTIQRDTRARRELERQRQRIKVLEQQLMDQQLLRLSEQNAQREAALASHGSTAHPSSDPPPVGSVMVHVKQLNRDGRRDETTPAELVVVALPREATVAELKQLLARRLGVDVARQVLVAKRATTGHEHVRLRDELPVAEYFLHQRTASRWLVSLLISDRLRVDWSKQLHLKQSTHAAPPAETTERPRNDAASVVAPIRDVATSDEPASLQ